VQQVYLGRSWCLGPEGPVIPTRCRDLASYRG
jgi:hypothetical protein